MKKKLWCFISLLVLAITAIFVVPSIKNIGINLNAAEEEPVEISIEAVSTQNGYGYPDESGWVTFKVSLSKVQKVDVFVYLETRDISAIAAKGDYAGIIGNTSGVKIDRNMFGKTFIITTNRAEYAVKGENGVIYSREFEIAITGVKGIENYKIVKSTARAMIGYNYVYELAGYADGTHLPIIYFKEYENVDKSPGLTTEEIDGEDSTKVYYDFSSTALYAHWKSHFIDSGLAEVHASLKGTIDDWGFSSTATYVSLLDGDKKELLFIRSNGYYDNERLEFNNIWHDGFDWIKDVSPSIHNSNGALINHYYEEVCCDCKYNLSSISDSHYNSYFARVLGTPNYTLELRSFGGYDRQLVNTHIYSTLIDRVVPYVEDDGVKVTSLTKVGDKLRASIRFNEPVYSVDDYYIEYYGQSYNLKPATIILYPNGNTKYPVTLTYCGGNLTDTLSFEIDYKTAVLPNEKVSYFTYGGGSGKINDFGYRSYKNAYQNVYFTNNSENLNNLSIKNNIPVEADVRIPTIQFDCATKKSIQKQHSVTVTLSGADLEGTTMYYSWEESKAELGNAIKEKSVYGSVDTKNTIAGGNYDGNRYLHVYVETKYGLGRYQVYDTELKFDNSSPTFEIESVDGNYKAKTFTLNISDNNSECNSGAKTIYLFYKKEYDYEYTVKSFKEISATVDGTVKVEVKASDLGIKSNDYSYVKLGFYLADALGNKPKVDYEANSSTYLFDSGNSFMCDYTSTNTEAGHEVLRVQNQNTFLISKNPDEDVFMTFKNVDILSEFNTLSPKLESLYNMYLEQDFSITYENPASDPTSIVVSLNPQDGFGYIFPGYYRFRFYVESLGEKYYSQYYYVYLSEDGGFEFPANYFDIFVLDKNQVYTNYVYQLSLTYPNYYYLDISGSLKQEPYASSSTAATFSSYDKAYQYVYVKELLDLYGKKITATEANYLNSGSVGTHRKAEGENTVAQEGQIWIRYKRAKWDYIDKESSWVWYCYDSSTNNTDDFEIDTTIGILPNLLSEALTNVSTKIAQNGKYIYLVGSDYTDKYGAPKLNDNQVHRYIEPYLYTNCDTPFASIVYFYGDEEIYSSKISYDNEEYFLATNFPLKVETYASMFYRPAGSNSSYKKMTFTEGMTFGDAIAANGLFEIIEASPSGIKQYKVYIDRQAPFVEISYVDTLGENRQIVLNQEYSGTYINAKSISIGQIQGEADNLAYILLYKTSNLKLLDVITLDELKQKPYNLADDHYTAYVYDRSGNYYVVNFRTNKDSLNCVINEEKNEYITIETNREASQIQYFEVYLNDELITNVFSNSLKYTKSGTYQVNVKDWYGNVESIEYQFNLTLPTVDWKYELNGQVYSYTDNSGEMKMQQLGDNEYFILSKGLLQFTLKSGYGYEFIGKEPEHSHSYINNRVKIKELTPFTIKIYYTNNPQIYVTYTASFDETPPSINALYIDKEYVYEELVYFMNNISNYNVGEILIPDSLEFSIDSSNINKISNGQQFDSDLISISFNDGSGIYNIKVYLNGKLIQEITYGEDYGDISLSRKGEYKIVATDVLGNVSELNFVNKNLYYHSFVVDSNERTLEDGLLYGNDNITVKLEENGQVTYLIKDENNNHYVSFVVENGVIYKSYYYVGKDENLNTTIFLDNSTKLFEINEKTKPNVYYDLLVDGLTFKVMYDENNNFKIKASVVDDATYEYECRVDCDNDEPFVYQGSLSKKKSDVVLNDYTNTPLTTNQNGEYLYISKEFSIDANSINDEINYIKVYYSLGGDEESLQYAYKDGSLLESLFNQDGIYRIEILNIYGNSTIYNLALSNTFIATSSVTDQQGNVINYSKDYADKLYSNNSITINAFSSNIIYNVTKDGKAYNTKADVENGQTSITLTQPGKYEVKLVDEYGNKKIFIGEIKSANLAFDEKLIYGYSENALKDYTNDKLSINHSLLETYGIYYVSVIYQEEEFALYDLISENKVEFDATAFENCIGFDGKAGEYIVVFKDRYGNDTRKVVYYSDVSTLQLSRVTRNYTETNYIVDDVIEEGFWSNMQLKFDTSSTNYVFKINNETYHLPYTLSFDNDAKVAEIEYKIYYLDEYGFEHEFSAYLCRNDIEINVLNTDTVVIGDLLTTKSNIKFSVDENTYVTYTIDGQNKTVYKGEELYKDGVYRIEVTDRAGNIEALTIKKDTFVYYEFFNVGKNQRVINGEVVNSNTVNFKVTGEDTSYIEKVFLNGVLLEKYDSTTFSENGKWEFIISDKMGNKSYFNFYQIIKSMQEFNYDTPEYYKISEIQYNSGNGVNISYMDYVKQNENNSTISLTENGTYKIKITSMLDNSSKTFEIKINNSAPEISLIGCEIDGSTKEDVKIDGYSVGDTVYIYKNGKLVSKTLISSKSVTPPTIKDGGEYKIVVESESGVKTTIKFKKDYIANTAGSVLITILILAVVICLFAGLLLRNKLKVDD